MRRLFESFLVLQGRSTGTTPMAGGQSHRLLALSSAQSSVAHSLGRPLARSLGHSVARSLFRSLSRPPRSPLRSTARPLCFFSALLFRCIRSALLFRVSLLMHSMIVFCASAGQTKRGFVSHSAAHIGAYSFHEDHIPRNVFVSPSL